MATRKELMDRDVKVVINAGPNDKGKDVLKTVNMNNIRHDATDEDVYATAKAIASVCAFPVSQVLEVDTNVIL